MKIAWRLLGYALQGIVMGTLLFFAILALIESSQQIQVFRYQGF